MPTRRFPPPWTFEEHNDACFIVKDANGVALAYVYYEQEPGGRTAANLMTRDEAPRQSDRGLACEAKPYGWLALNSG
jgi:hypothetical protein